MNTHRPTPDVARGRGPARGFTLVELLVVILIVGLVSAVTLPAVVNALGEREMLDASAIFQSSLLSTRDTAARNGTITGVRLLPDPDLFNANRGYAANRMVTLEQAPNYNSGRCFLRQFEYVVPVPTPSGPVPVRVSLILAIEDKSLGASPTSWYWNIRQGERLRIGDSGRLYTVVGPVRTPPGPLNPQGFVNLDDLSTNAPRIASLPIPNGSPTGIAPPRLEIPVDPNTLSPGSLETFLYINGSAPANPTLSSAEYLILVNGIDDDRDGLIDEQCDGLNNDGDLLNGAQLADPAFGPVHPNNVAFDITANLLFRLDPSNPLLSPGEYEPEELDSVSRQLVGPQRYTIIRRPVVSESAREVTLPANIVIDLIGSGTAVPDRSRLPVDPTTGYVDILFAPNGQVREDSMAFNIPAGNRNLSFYHFWLAHRDDVKPPTQPPTLLPTPLKDRRLVTLFTKSGEVVVNTVTDDMLNSGVEAPYQAAQSGVREP